MIKELRNYQEKAVTGLLRRFDSLLESSENGICILKAPTGSGKTIICAEFLKRFVTDKTTDEKFSFIWISLRGLHHQSKAKLENYYESNNLITCSYFEDLMDKKIDENEILFINWERINKKDINILIQENEQQNDLGSVLKNTKNDGRQIILIIDESHHTAGAPESKKLIEIISPKITFEISATPQLGDTFPETEHVTLNAVKEEQMIKSEITLNPEFNKKKINSQSATDMVLEQALKKREQLKKLYQKVGSNVNPLVLIQIPDKKEKQDKKKEEVIKKLESNFKISEKNNKLAIWLSEDKSKNLPNIEKEDSEVEVLLFKQAIALGWDCPRASILIIFRESTNVTFTIQVIGRIMRMPEPDIGYYSESELNRAFIFTNLSGYTIAQDYAKGYITINESKRRDAIYQDLHLTSVSFKKQREKTRLTGKFVKIFNEISTKNKHTANILIKP